MKTIRNNSNKYISGITLIEVIVGIGIITIILVGLISAFQVFLKASLTNTEKIQSAFLLEEGMEVVRFLRDENWSNISNLTNNIDYYTYFSGTNWNITSIATTTNSFTRKIIFSDVYRRNSDSDIVASTSPDAKTLDVNSRFVTIRVSSDTLDEVKLQAYITNLFSN